MSWCPEAVPEPAEVLTATRDTGMTARDDAAPQDRQLVYSVLSCQSKRLFHFLLKYFTDTEWDEMIYA